MRLARVYSLPRGVGYWDYGLDRRDWLFTPVAFRGGYYNRGYYYTPRNLVDAALLTAALFIGPNQRHYYYGDFYGRRGYEPWFAWHLGGRGYDPVFAHDYGRNRDWYDRLARDFRDGRKDADARRRSYEDIANEINRFRRERGEPVVNQKTSLFRPLDKAIDPRRDRDKLFRLEETQRRAAASSDADGAASFSTRYRVVDHGRWRWMQ